MYYFQHFETSDQVAYIHIVALLAILFKVKIRIWPDFDFDPKKKKNIN